MKFLTRFAAVGLAASAWMGAADPASAQSTGWMAVPSTTAQFFGYGYGAGHHAPIVRTPAQAPLRMDRRTWLPACYGTLAPAAYATPGCWCGGCYGGLPATMAPAAPGEPSSPAAEPVPPNPEPAPDTTPAPAPGDEPHPTPPGDEPTPLPPIVDVPPEPPAAPSLVQTVGDTSGETACGDPSLRRPSIGTPRASDLFTAPAFAALSPSVVVPAEGRRVADLFGAPSLVEATPLLGPPTVAPGPAPISAPPPKPAPPLAESPVRTPLFTAPVAAPPEGTVVR
jgi:hypothetical protein